MHACMNISSETLAAFCDKHHIRRLAPFGSQLSGEAGPSSDIDLLVEFDHDHIPGLFRLEGMEIELTELLGRRVDLRTVADLSRHFRADVERSAQVQFAR
jgi:predicted nucleotidyltransferase